MSSDRTGLRGDVYFLSFWAGLFCVAGIGLGSLASWDEAYYALVSREIFRRNDWVHLWYFNTPFYDKPPLYLWVTAFFYHLFGVNEFSARLGSGLAGVGTVLATYFLGRRLLGRAAALAGAGILLSSSDFLHYARWGTLDVMHLFFFTLAVLFYFKAVERPVHWLGFWLASAAAVMTKGPLIVLAWPLLFCDSAARRDFSFVKRASFWAGMALAALLVLPWHIAVYLANPLLFVQGILIKHYIARTGSAVEGHTGNAYFYIRTLINKTHPWILLAPAALPWAVWRASKSWDKQAFRLLLLWVAVVLGFFTFAVKTKLQWYVLPLSPALCLLLGGFVARLTSAGKEAWLKAAVIVTLFLQVPFSHVLVQDYAPALKDLASEVRNAVPENEPVFLYDHHEQPSATFYFDRDARYADSLKELDDAARDHPRLVLLIPKERHFELVPDLNERGFRKLAQTDRFKTDLVLLEKG